MSAVVPLLAEALNLAITEHWPDVGRLRSDGVLAADYRQMTGFDDVAAHHGERFSAGLEALAVALHARLQEQGSLT